MLNGMILERQHRIGREYNGQFRQLMERNEAMAREAIGNIVEQIMC